MKGKLWESLSAGKETFLRFSRGIIKKPPRPPSPPSARPPCQEATKTIPPWPRRYPTSSTDTPSATASRSPSPPSHPPTPDAASPLDSLADELLFLVLDCVAQADPRALKSFALASRACHAAESRHRRVVRPLRAGLLPAALARNPSTTGLDLSLYARVPTAALAFAISGSSSSCAALRTVDLSRSRRFGAAGVAALAASCPGLADLDLSNGVDLGDVAAAEVVRARELRRLSLARWKPVTDMGLGCVVIGCTELRELSFKWCLGVSDLGIHILGSRAPALRCGSRKGNGEERAWSERELGQRGSSVSRSLESTFSAICLGLPPQHELKPDVFFPAVL